MRLAACVLAVVLCGMTTAHGAPILLKAGTITPEAKGTPKGRLLSAGNVNEASIPSVGLYLIQHDGNITPEWKDALEAVGAKIRSYIPEDAYLIEASADAYSAIRSTVAYTYLGEFKPEYRYDPAIAPMTKGTKSNARLLAASGDATESTDEEESPIVYDILLFEDGQRDGVVERMKSVVGCTVERADGSVVRASLTKAALVEISSWVEVHWIELYVEPRLCNNVAVEAPRMNVKSVWPGGNTDLELTGKGQIVGVADTGFDTGAKSPVHKDVRGRIVAAFPLGRKDKGDWSDPSGHGTHVVGSVLGNGAQSDGQFKGVAYEASLVFQSIMDAGGGLDGIPGDLNTLFEQAYNAGARIHSNSWGAGRQNNGSIGGDASCLGYYSDDSIAIDSFMFNHPDMLILFAAGNDGVDWSPMNGIIDEDSIGSQPTAKNCITVGASENFRISGGYSGYKWYPWPKFGKEKFPEDPIASDYISRPSDNSHQGMAAFSSRGPCDDGRIKPDIVAPGTDILSLSSSVGPSDTWGPYNDYYRYLGGTSMACPLVAGAAALVRQWLVEHRNIPNPDAASIKALLLAGAKSLYPGQYDTGQSQEIPSNYPNNVEGWGQVNVSNTVANVNGVLVYDAEVIAHDEEQMFSIQATEGQPLAIVMAYTDAPGSTTSKKALVHDLDMTVVSPSGKLYYPNSKQTKDAINNVEGVRLEGAEVETGTYSIRVKGFKIDPKFAMNTSLTGGKANAIRYSLVVNGGREILPGAPKVKVSGNKLTWDAVEGAKYYKVYRSTNPFADPDEYSSGWQTALSYPVEKPTAEGAVYFYFVKASVDGTDLMAGPFSKVGVSKSSPNDPKLKYAENPSFTAYNPYAEFHLYGTPAEIRGSGFVSGDRVCSVSTVTTRYLTFVRVIGPDGIAPWIDGNFNMDSFDTHEYKINAGGLNSLDIRASSNVLTTPRECAFYTKATYGGTEWAAADKEGYWYLRPHYIYQAGQTDFRIATTTQDAAATEGVYSVKVTATPVETMWRVTSDVPWIVPYARMNEGSGTLGYKVLKSEEKSTRTGTLTFTCGTITKTLRVTQAGAESTKYTVRFEANGGTVNEKDRKVKEGEAVGTLPTPSKIGCDFAGWFTKKDGGTKVTATTKVAADVIYYAHWTAQTFKVCYRAGEWAESGDDSDDTKTYGIDLTLKGVTYHRTGYTQTGWTTNGNGNVKAYGLGESYMKNAAITLYPFWKVNTYDVEYSLGGGSHGSDVPTGKAIFDKEFRVSAPKKDGYTFSGWTVTTGLNVNTARYGVESNKVTTGIANASTKCFNGENGDVWFKNLTAVSVGKVTLTATWKEKPKAIYKVTFHENGGTGTMQPQNFTQGVPQALTSNSFVRAEYTFKGWSDGSPQGAVAYTDGQTISPASDKDLYAQWSQIPIYYVTFEANGGTGSMSPQKFTRGETQSLAKNSFTKADHVFSGWATNATGAVMYSDGQSIAITAKLTLYAKWTVVQKETYRVKYSPGALGTGGESESVKTNGIAMTLPNGLFTRTGYTQTGWATSDGGSKEYDLGASYTVNAPRTLYPFWTANVYGVSYDLGGGVKGANAPAKATYDDSPFRVSAPTRQGYTFAGWTVSGGLNSGTAKFAKSANGQMTAISGPATVCANGTTGDVWFLNVTAEANGSVVLKANWTENPKPTWMVTFDANGGTTPEKSRKVTDGMAVGTLPVPTRESGTFRGWFTAKTGGEQANASMVVTEDITLYAIWDVAITHTVKFYPNMDDFGVIESGEYERRVEHGQPLGELPICVLKGNLEEGPIYTYEWRMRWEGSSVWFKPTCETIVTNNAVLGARWIQNDSSAGASTFGFYASHVEAAEGSAASISIMPLNRGTDGQAASVDVYLTYGTASATDLDLSRGTVGGTTPAGGLKFPLTLSWAAGDTGRKTITIPIRRDTMEELDEEFVLQMANAKGVDYDNNGICVVTIASQMSEPDFPTIQIASTGMNVGDGRSLKIRWDLRFPQVWGDDDEEFDSMGEFDFYNGSLLWLTGGGWYRYSSSRSPLWFTGWYVLTGDEFTQMSAYPEEWVMVSADYDRTYLGAFEKVPYIRGLPKSANRGVVNGSGYCRAGERIVLNAVGKADYAFTGWYATTTTEGNYDNYNLGSGLKKAIATTSTIVIDRTTKPLPNTKTSTTISNVMDNVKYGDAVTYYAYWRYVGPPEDGSIRMVFADSYKTETDGTISLCLAEQISSQSAAQLSLTGLPAGLNYNATTKTIGGKATSPGAYTVTASATNAKTKTPVTATFDVIVATSSTVTFKSNGGTGVMPPQTFTNGIAQALNANVFERFGYTFAGWAEEPLGEVAYSDRQRIAVESEEMVLYAKWSSNTFKIFYDANGGSGTVSPLTVTNGVEFSLSGSRYSVSDGSDYYDLPALRAPSGHLLAGWATNATGEAVYAGGCWMVMTRDSDLTLYAQWEWSPFETKVELDAAGGFVSPSYVAFPHPEYPMPIRSGYIFDGWYTAAEGGTKVEPWTKIEELESMTVYAHWFEPSDSFDLFTTGGGAAWSARSDGSWRSGAISDRQMSWIERVVDGPGDVYFAMDVSSNGAYDSDHLAFYIDGTYKTSLYGGASSSEDNHSWHERRYTIASDGKHVLRWVYSKDDEGSAGEDCAWLCSVKWIPLDSIVHHKIIFNPNGGSLAAASDIVFVDENRAIGSLPTPVRSKYKFLGWFTEKDGGTKVTATTKVTADITYYAHWEYDGSAMVAVKVADGCEGMGSVSGGNAPFKPGAKVSLKATANKGYVFVGWREIGTTGETPVLPVLSKAASFTYVATGEPVSIVAVFATIEEDSASLNMDIMSTSTTSDGICVFDIGECIKSLSESKLTVKGVPAGLKFDARTGIISGKATKPGTYKVTVSATNATVKKAVTATFEIVVPNLSCDALANLEPERDAYGVVMCGVAFDTELVDCTPAEGWAVKAAGLPTGLKYDAKTGKITGVPTKAGTYTVTFTATKGKEKQIATITLNVEALPTWATGTFTGYVAGTRDACPYQDGDDELNGRDACPYHGSATMTAAASGKISGKVALDGTNWTFSAASFSRVEHVERVDGGVATNFIVEAEAKAGKAARIVELAVSGHAGRVTLPSGGAGDGGRGATALPNGIVEGTFGEDEVAMWRNMWKDKATAAEAKATIAEFLGVYTMSMEVGDGGRGATALPGHGYLSLTVGKDGNAKATGKLADGTSVSATSPLMYDEEAGWFVLLYAAPSAYKGGAFAAAVGFVADDTAVAGRPPYQLSPVLFAPLWTSRNPQATGEYGAGFGRRLDFTGAYYDKAKKLNEYYETLRFTTVMPALAFTHKRTYLGDNGKKATTSSIAWCDGTEGILDQVGCVVTVNAKGQFSVVKATKPVQDKETKKWYYDGENDGALSLSFTQATGIFKGSYTFWYDYQSAADETTGKETWTHTSKKVNFEGVMVQGEEELRGFYLWDVTGYYDDPKTGKAKTFKYKESYPVLFQSP